MSSPAWAWRSRSNSARNGVRSCRASRRKFKRCARFWRPKFTTRRSWSASWASPCGRKSQTTSRRGWRTSRRAMCKFWWKPFAVNIPSMPSASLYRFICCIIYRLTFLISYQTVESKVDGFKTAVVETPMWVDRMSRFWVSFGSLSFITFTSTNSKVLSRHMSRCHVRYRRFSILKSLINVSLTP